ncbi:MAG: hypothetical protein PHW02_06690 [bacterium]|nr:hypothetical protein [bacterium]
MKNLVIYVAFLIFAFTLFGEECPFGLSDDPYPGKCGRYVDEDGNDLCDLSENASKDTLKVNQGADTVKTEELKLEAENEGEGNQNRHGKNNEKEEIEEEKDPLAETPLSVTSADTQNAEKEEYPVNREQMKNLFGSKKKKSSPDFKDKYFLMVLLPLFAFALILSYMSKKKKISLDVCTINRWTNIVILLTFVVASFTSVMLVLAEYKILGAKNLSSLIFTHNFIGIIFILSTTLHIYLKWQFYVSFFKCYIRKETK